MPKRVRISNKRYKQTKLEAGQVAEINYIKSLSLFHKMRSADETHTITDLIIPGVYMLMLGESIVYVGQSVSVIERILTHKNDSNKSFDGYKFIKIDTEEERLSTEKILIKRYKPLYNIVHNKDNKGKTVSLSNKEATRAKYKMKKAAAEFAKKGGVDAQRKAAKKYRTLKDELHFHQMQTTFHQD